MQGTRVQALIREDPTCHGATKPVSHNYWACALEPTSHNYRAHVPQLLKPAQLEPMLCNKRSHHEKPTHCNEEWPRLTATRESPCAATKTQCSQKLKNKINNFFFLSEKRTSKNVRGHIYIFQHQFSRWLQEDVSSTEFFTIYLSQIQHPEISTQALVHLAIPAKSFQTNSLPRTLELKDGRRAGSSISSDI